MQHQSARNNARTRRAPRAQQHVQRKSHIKQDEPASRRPRLLFDFAGEVLAQQAHSLLQRARVLPVQLEQRPANQKTTRERE